MREAQEKAYSEERGKRVATHEDIEHAVRDIRALTTETERIKTDNARLVWMNQWLQTQKADAYVEVLTIGDILVGKQAYALVAYAMAVSHKTRTALPLSLPDVSEIHPETPPAVDYQLARKTADELYDRLQIALVRLRLFCPACSADLVDRLWSGLQEHSSEDPELAQRGLSNFRSALGEIAAVARTDLSISK
jgi:hypothetical protein